MLTAAQATPGNSEGEGQPPASGLPVASTPPPVGRRRFSLRFCITAGFLLCFLLALSITLLSYCVLVHLQTKLHFLEVADTVVLELQQARRFEKNFFLYGTNLADALAQVHTAQQLLRVNAGRLAEVVGSKQVEALQQELLRYAQGLDACLTEGQLDAEGKQRARAEVEAELRRSGAAVLAQGLNLVQQERQAVARMLALAKQVPMYYLGFLFMVMAFLAHKLSRQILGPLARLKRFTRRIAQGDVTPLTPVHHYQDELYDLTQAMNLMLAELQRRQEVLMQTQKLRALGTLTAGVAHELNNPINNITLTAYTLRDDGQSLTGAEKVEMLQEIINESDRLRDIVGNLLDYARESEISREPLDLGQLLQGTLLLVSKQIKLAGARLEVELPPSLPPVSGDRRQLRQAILNILINALDAIAEDGRIRVVVCQENPETVALAIQDNGVGISPAILPYIFDPFFTTKPPGHGTGLGLAVSQGIIARHGGAIRVASEPGRGTTLTVLLPVERGAAPDPALSG
ncbi:MAG: sensor histidine kinase [Desulfobacca sp.]